MRRSTYERILYLGIVFSRFSVRWDDHPCVEIPPVSDLSRRFVTQA